MLCPVEAVVGDGVVGAAGVAVIAIAKDPAPLLQHPDVVFLERI